MLATRNIKLGCILILISLNYLSAFYNLGPLGPGNLKYTGSPLIQPQVIESSNGKLDLSLSVAQYNYKGYISFTTRAYYYNGIGSIPGPTIKVKPGDTLTITLTNNLSGSTATNNSNMNMDNMFHGPDVTNLHTHGLHVDPNEDSIFKLASPGQTITYKLIIPTDHAPGLHWYHSHKHGSSALQVMGGLFGAIVIDPIASQNIPSQFSTWSRIVLLFQHFSTETKNTTDDPFRVRTYTSLQTSTGDTLAPNFQFENAQVKDIYLVNGQFQPTYSMKANVPVIFDMVHSSGDHYLELEIRDAINAGNSACTITLIAYDGVYFTEARSVAYNIMVPGQRTSAVITCSTPGTYYFQTYANDVMRYKVMDDEIRFNQNLLTLVVTAGDSTATAIPSLSSIVRPAYLNDLRTVTPKSSWEISVDQDGAGNYMWFGIGKDCTIQTFGRGTANVGYQASTTCKYSAFPGQLTNTGTYRHTGTVGTVEQLKIWGRGASPHTIHIHVNHFQIINHASGNNGEDDYLRYYGAAGDWRDTVPALEGYVTTRYTLNQFEGEIVLHCHFLAHEDMGMMATFYAGSKSCNYPDTCKASPVDGTNEASSESSWLNISGATVLISLLIALIC
jgi:FtsP/CotA-like multicopper oxidase with cupredoxin domain